MLYSPDSAAVNVFSTFSTCDIDMLIIDMFSMICDISTLDDNFLQIFTETGIAFLLSFTDWLFFFFWPWRTDIKEPLQWVRQSSQLPGYRVLPWHGSLCPCISAEIRTHHSACAVWVMQHLPGDFAVGIGRRKGKYGYSSLTGGKPRHGELMRLAKSQTETWKQPQTESRSTETQPSAFIICLFTDFISAVNWAVPLDRLRSFHLQL